MVGSIIAHVKFRGTIRERSVEPFVRLLEAVMNKRKVKGMLWDVSSGGGDSVASYDLYMAVKRVNQVKPVIATIGSVAASGGYMAVLGAFKIYAYEDSDVGSIGVFIPHIAARGLLDKLGVKVELLHHGRHKDAYQGLRDLTDEERTKILKVAEVGYNSFMALVAKERKQSAEKILELATGEYWSGKQALELGLVDAIGDRTAALMELSRLTGVPTRKRVEISPPRPFIERLLNGPMSAVGSSLADSLYSSMEESLEDQLLNGGRMR
jgi:protease-4